MQQTPTILTVSQLTNAIKLQLERNFLHVTVRGEVSNLKLQASGHLYFCLKDSYSQVSCVMFKQSLVKAEVPIKEGSEIVIQGEINVYPPRGSYQIVVKTVSLIGLGELLVKLELLKQKLQKLGFFDPARKKKIPKFPKRIGVVTSPTGAVIRDVINILTRRLVGFHLIVNPVRVQGDGADVEIARAIEEFNRLELVDVIIVCRGGGSIEDLAPFNSEKVAQALFESKIPTISAVGHETDTSISDFVADLRAPTPSSAAEMVSFERHQLVEKLAKTSRHVGQLVLKNIALKRNALQSIVQSEQLKQPSRLIQVFAQQLDDMHEELSMAIKRIIQKQQADCTRMKKLIDMARPSYKIQEKKKMLSSLAFSLENSMKFSFLHLKKRYFGKQFEERIRLHMAREISLKKERLHKIHSHMQSLNPKNILQKGYSILFSRKDGSVINSIHSLHAGDSVRMLVADGEAEGTITKVLQ
jgi:exodeoxyribonuclease VII large subunit